MNLLTPFHFITSYDNESSFIHDHWEIGDKVWDLYTVEMLSDKV